MERGKPLALAQCCGPHLAGTPAPDAQALMRSRYSAYVLEDEAYLLATWHATTRPAQLALEATKWLGLELRGHRATGEGRAEVEFVARYRVAGKGMRLHERSRFVRDDGRWYYLDGEMS